MKFNPVAATAERAAVGVGAGAALREEQAANAAAAAAQRRAAAAEVEAGAGAGAGAAAAERNAAQVEARAGAGAGAAAAERNAAQVEARAAEEGVEMVQRRPQVENDLGHFQIRDEVENPQVVLPAAAERERLLQPRQPQVAPIPPPPSQPVQPIAQLRAVSAPRAQGDVLGLGRAFPAEKQQLAAVDARQAAAEAKKKVNEASIARTKPVRGATQTEGKNLTQKAAEKKQADNLDDGKQVVVPARRKRGKNAKPEAEMQQIIEMERIRDEARAQERLQTTPARGALQRVKDFFTGGTRAGYTTLYSPSHLP